MVIVGGDSDYVPLAQRCKRLGRYVVGVGVAGSTAKSLAAACDQLTRTTSFRVLFPRGATDEEGGCRDSRRVERLSSPQEHGGSRR